MNKIQDPKAASFQNLLSGIYGRQVSVQPTAKVDPTAVKPCALAVFVDNEDQVMGLLVCPLVTAAYMGAALSLLPKGVADDCARAGKLDESLIDNFGEVANICSSFFTEQLGLRVHYKAVVPKAAAPLPEHKSFLQTATRVDVLIDIPNYGSGALSVRLAKLS